MDGKPLFVGRNGDAVVVRQRVKLQFVETEAAVGFVGPVAGLPDDGIVAEITGERVAGSPAVEQVVTVPAGDRVSSWTSK